MKILNDSEHRIFLSAMSRERKVCSSAEFRDEFGVNKLLDLCDSIERKVNDAVPVVRCKDCVCAYLWMNDGTGKIGKCAFLIGDNQYVTADGFCNLGERKGGDE